MPGTGAGIGVGIGIGPSFQQPKKPSFIERALAILSGAKVYALAITTKIGESGKRLIGIIKNIKL